MIEEQFAKHLNFFERQGKNVNDFSIESLKTAVNSNYQGKKFADAICTEDSFGFLTIVPSDQIDKWARLEGAVRPAGRNPYTVWTPLELERQIIKNGGHVLSNVATVPLSSLEATPPRGGTGTSRYKISPLFFVRAEDVSVLDQFGKFRLEDVRQLKPTIAAKMFFEELDVSLVKRYYEMIL
jgi:hypothetical protein